MPIVDPVLKQDLMTVKAGFEQGALEQSGRSAYIPFRPMIQQTRLAHQAIQTNVGRYPSFYAKDRANASFIDKVQQECIPCSARIRLLADVDMSVNLYYGLDAYNAQALDSMIEFFKHFKGQGFFSVHLCDAYAALREHCIPDLTRLIAALALLLADIRRIDLRALVDGFLNFMVSILAKMVVGYATGLDRFTHMITSTLRCMAEDIKYQISKLDPILTAEGRQRSSEAFRRAWRANDDDKNWLQANREYNPVYSSQATEAIDKAVAGAENISDKLTRTTVGFNKTILKGGGGQALLAIQGLMNMSIGRVEVSLDGALQELLKLLKANTNNMKAMNQLYQQIHSITEMLGILQALVDSAGAKELYDPCGPDRGRRFFNNLQIPGRDVYIAPPADEGRPEDDVDVIISDEPIEVENPIVREVLEGAGIRLHRVSGTGEDGSEDLKFEIEAEPITINFFACMKQARV